MADLAGLMGLNIKDQTALAEWELTHFNSHVAIRIGIQAQTGKNLALWPLYPVNWDDWSTYSLWHQSAHNEMNDALGLPGTDLMSVNLQDQEQADEWHLDHYREHFAASNTLKI